MGKPVSVSLQRNVQQEVKTVLSPQIGLQHSRTASDIGAYLRSAGKGEVSQPKKESPLVQQNPMAAILQKEAEQPRMPQSPQLGLQHSKTASEIGTYLRSAGREELPQPKKESPLVQRNPMSAILQKEAEQPKVPQSPQLGLQHSKSFNKFKNAFEDGKGVMDEGTMVEVSKSRSAIANMFESQGPKMTFGGGERKAETTADPAKPKPAPKKKEDGPMNERKWVFDTIQKYFD